MELTQALHRALQLYPDETATITTERTRTWFECADRVARLAGGLRQLGLRLVVRDRGLKIVHELGRVHARAGQQRGQPGLRVSERGGNWPRANRRGRCHVSLRELRLRRQSRDRLTATSRGRGMRSIDVRPASAHLPARCRAVHRARSTPRRASTPRQAERCRCSARVAAVRRA